MKVFCKYLFLMAEYPERLAMGSNIHDSFFMKGVKILLSLKCS